MKIYELVWQDDRVAHIAEHAINPEEVEEVCFGRPFVQRAKSFGENPVFYVLGQTAAGAFQSMEKTMKTSQIPHTDSIEELAQFWDTHDLTDCEEELEEVDEKIFERRPETVVSLHLRPQEAEAVRQVAKAIGRSCHVPLKREASSPPETLAEHSFLIHRPLVTWTYEELKAKFQ